MEEFEIKFLDVDVAELENKLSEIGATKIGEYFFRRRHFDYPDLSLHKNGEWIRVRDEGDKITMAHKKIAGFNFDIKVSKDVVVEEQEVEISDFDTAWEIFFALGLIEKNYLENKRIRYIKDGVEYDIDTFPQIPTYLEIEGENMTVVEKAARELGLDPSNSVRYPGWQIYKDYGIDLGDYQSITFEGMTKKENFAN